MGLQENAETNAETSAETQQLNPSDDEANIAKHNKLEELKHKLDAAILAHYYVPADVQDAADYVGDSFYLAKLATDLPNKTIVLCGVGFMAESVKLLNPEKRVLLPDPNADCPMAHMVTRDQVQKQREIYGDDLAVVCYVNSTAEIKSWSDVCVTSSNAVKIVSALPQKNVLFIPDKNLGHYVAQQVPDKNIILIDGYCPRHDFIDPKEIEDLKEQFPKAVVLAHPECNADVLALSDYIGSTSGIIERVVSGEESDYIIATVHGVSHTIAKKHREATSRYIFLQASPLVPTWMALHIAD